MKKIKTIAPKHLFVPRREEIYSIARSKDTKYSFFVSIAAHLFFFLFLLYMKEKEPVQISFNVKLLQTEKRIPKAKIEEIKSNLKKLEKIKQEKPEIKTKNAKTTESLKSKSSDLELRAPDASVKKPAKSSDEFADDFEKTLFSRKETQKSIRTGTGGQAESSSWEKEAKKTSAGSEGKKESSETVKIPEGKTGAGSIQWKTGYKRVLTHIPYPAYPKYFRQRGIQGSVVILFEVNSAGKVVSVRVKKSSGHTKLDLLAKNAVRDSRFSAIPGGKDMTRDKGEIEIHFELTR
ncbi:MAG: energy transducer TonB [Spirochaetia bacterium]|nr:energy transducer TonB [Spirochaetia bacterium]